MLEGLASIEQFGQDGVDGITKLLEYLKKRAAVEEEYSKSLSKLDKAVLADKSIDKSRSAGFFASY